jgi:NAD-dependent protein deacetylases, SIR2 family
MNPVMIEAIARRLESGGRLTVMSGAGISAESGIPTFRGTEGYWTVGSRVYHPQEMATRAMFDRSPREVWRWYLYRMGVCRQAAPNAGHRAVVDLERLLGERFTLITQNVDGLHLRAGSSPGRALQIHGNVFLCGALANVRRQSFPFRPMSPPRSPTNR